jgi:hypothetical protein
MNFSDDSRELEFKESIKNIERQRFWFPIVVLVLLIGHIWLAGGDIFERPTMETVYPLVILITLLFVGMEVLTVKILLIKAEYRDWLRDFRKAKWDSINKD